MEECYSILIWDASRQSVGFCPCSSSSNSTGFSFFLRDCIVIYTSCTIDQPFPSTFYPLPISFFSQDGQYFFLFVFFNDVFFFLFFLLYSFQRQVKEIKMIKNNIHAKLTSPEISNRNSLFYHLPYYAIMCAMNLQPTQICDLRLQSLCLREDWHRNLLPI